MVAAVEDEAEGSPGSANLNRSSVMSTPSVLTGSPMVRWGDIVRSNAGDIACNDAGK